MALGLFSKIKCMQKYTTLVLLACLFSLAGNAQSDSTMNPDTSGVFHRIVAAMHNFRVDTSAAPDDKITRKIKELRNVNGGFNIDEVVRYKLAEDKQKGELLPQEMERLSAFFTAGDGKKWLDNAMIWIYRNLFTYDELKQLVQFYKTSAGQKMIAHFPVLMVQSLRAAETIREAFDQQKAVKD